MMWRDVMSCGWTRGHESWVVPAGVSSALAVLRAEIPTRIDSCTVWGGGCFSFGGQYSILKSLISTCVLSYIGSREYWLFDRVCES